MHISDFLLAINLEIYTKYRLYTEKSNIYREYHF